MYTLCIGDTAQYIYIIYRCMYIRTYVYSPYVYIHQSAWENKLDALTLVFNVYYIGLQFS